MIKFVDLKTTNCQFTESLIKVLESGQYISGPQVESFEHEVSQYLGSRYSIAVNSGTDALVLALETLDIGPGHEVITTPFTFVASVEAIRRVGAKPVFVDIEADSYNMDASQIEKKINSFTRAVLAVNLFGNPCDAVVISQLCRRHNLQFVLDSAQAFGAKISNHHINDLADITTFSFFPTKVLGGVGDSGMLVTNLEKVNCQARRLRNHGSLTKSEYSIVGYNSRMDEIQAAILREKLKQIEDVLELRGRQASLYGELLPQGILCPKVRSDCCHAWNIYTISVSARDSLKQYLTSLGIETAIYYSMPLNEMPAYYDSQIYPRAKEACRNVLSLPLGPHLATDDIEKVCHEVDSWCKRNNQTVTTF